MATTSKAIKAPRYRDLVAWKALKERDLEYALNLLVAGEWRVDGVVRDGWSSLDARVGSERCQETAALALVLRRIVVGFLKDEGLDKEFDELVTEYRDKHVSDKEWTAIFKTEDVLVNNSPRYDLIKRAVIDKIGDDWTTFLGLARTLTSFSTLTNMEAGMPMRYRRKSDVLVETSEAQRDTGMSDYHDAEFPMRTVFTRVSFKLIEGLANDIVGDKAVPFGKEPRACATLEEQAREVFHFSEANKINSAHKEYPVVVGSFSASTIILIGACRHYRIPITECMVRLEYDGPLAPAYDEPAEQTDYEALQKLSLDDTEAVAPTSVTYRVTAVPVHTYATKRDNGGGFKLVDPKKEGIEDEPCWKLGGYSMYNKSQTGSLLSSPDDDEYIAALREYSAYHRLALFGFFHNEYPAATEDGGIDLLPLINKVCEGRSPIAEVTLETIGINLGIDIDDQRNATSLLSLSAACGNLSRKYDLQDTFIARQRDPGVRSAYLMQRKQIPYTYNHIEISTPSLEMEKWGKLMKKVRSTDEPMYANLFTAGNAAYSISDQAEADALMRVNNTNQQVKRLITHHPGHTVYLTEEHARKLVSSEGAGKKGAGKSGNKKK